MCWRGKAANAGRAKRFVWMRKRRTIAKYSCSSCGENQEGCAGTFPRGRSVPHDARRMGVSWQLVMNDLRTDGTSRPRAATSVATREREASGAECRERPFPLGL